MSHETTIGPKIQQFVFIPSTPDTVIMDQIILAGPRPTFNQKIGKTVEVPAGL